MRLNKLYLDWPLNLLTVSKSWKLFLAEAAAILPGQSAEVLISSNRKILIKKSSNRKAFADFI